MSPDWDATTYGERFAPVYDEWYAARGDVEVVVDALAALASGGRVLELGVGTGRLALPLAARGVAVEGVDASRAMVSRLRAKDTAGRVPAVVADMARLPLRDGRYALVFVAANTLFNLPTGDDQARCLRDAARVVAPGGRVVVEAFVPDVDRLAQPDVVTVRSIEPDRVVLFASKSDVAAQRLDTAIVELAEGEAVRVFPARLRWAAPDELDHLAAAAGLALESRWGGWDRRPFGEESEAHVTVWRTARPSP